jgi:hypothetical protein
MVYDNDNFSVDLPFNIELYSILYLALSVIGFFGAFMNAEYYTAVY